MSAVLKSQPETGDVVVNETPRLRLVGKAESPSHPHHLGPLSQALSFLPSALAPYPKLRAGVAVAFLAFAAWFVAWSFQLGHHLFEHGIDRITDVAKAAAIALIDSRGRQEEKAEVLPARDPGLALTPIQTRERFSEPGDSSARTDAVLLQTTLDLLKFADQRCAALEQKIEALHHKFESAAADRVRVENLNASLRQKLVRADQDTDGLARRLADERLELIRVRAERAQLSDRLRNQSPATPVRLTTGTPPAASGTPKQPSMPNRDKYGRLLLPDGTR
jgi:hypothetical protein